MEETPARKEINLNAATDRVREAVDIEIAELNVRFPKLQSKYEGWALLYEKIRALRHEVDEIEKYHKQMLWYITQDGTATTEAKVARESAFLAAHDAVNVVAVMQKYLNTFDMEETHENGTLRNMRQEIRSKKS